MNKDLCIITNIFNSHYYLLFSKKHKAQKINNILFLDNTLNNSNISNIVYNNTANVDKNKTTQIDFINRKNFR